MAEAIISRRGYVENNNSGGNLQPNPDYCTLVVSVYDSNGGNFSDVLVRCNDGYIVMNKHTNESGKAIFYINKSSCDISAVPVSIKNGYCYIDQYFSQNKSINCHLNTIIKEYLSFNKRNNARFNHYSTDMNVVANNTNTWIGNNVIFKVTNRISGYVGGGGGGGGGSYNDPSNIINGNSGGGGGGGALNRFTSIQVSKNTPYKCYIGSGGSRGGRKLNGGSGGTTSAFGYSAVGGGGGSWMRSGGLGKIGYGGGGDGGDSAYYVDGKDGINGYGGGGSGGGVWSYIHNAGSPGGGTGGWYNRINGSSGIDGLGGGGGGGSQEGRNNNTNGYGGYGGSGTIWISDFS